MNSEITVSVINNSSRTHNDVIVIVTGYDENGDITKKTTTFERTLAAYGSFSKPVLMPAKTVSCDYSLISSNPQ
jgi:hypothetical protein